MRIAHIGAIAANETLTRHQRAANRTPQSDCYRSECRGKKSSAAIKDVSAIEANHPHQRTLLAAAIVLAALVLVIMAAAPAYAGQASSGELLFYPCDSCHPLTPGALIELPNGFESHAITLEGHDVLGVGTGACLACHDDPTGDPGRLKLADGSFTDITGDVSAVCYRCHSDKYGQWQAGTHGRSEPSCSAAGCHDPHTPAWIYVGPLSPFTGTGFQVSAVSNRAAFTPLASPPIKPPVHTPRMLWIATMIGAVLSAGFIGFLVSGRSIR